MSAERLEVLHRHGRVGTLERSRARIIFTYDEEWRAREDATPLSTSMPLTAREHRARVVEPFLWGLLPDNDTVLRRWGREFGVSVAHPFGLVAAVGEDLPGAVQFVRSERVDEIENEGEVEWLGEPEVAELLRTVRRDHTAWLGPRSEGRWSLAGAQAKIALLRDGDRWGRPSGRFATTHILKPAIAALDNHDLNEHLCLGAARHLGLRVVRTSIVAFEEERAIAVERYDRRPGTHGPSTRIHQEDMCQALAVHPSEKYESDGGPTAADIVRLLRERIRSHQASEASVRAFVDALAYNWIIAGPDAHAKNYALLLSGSQVRLAPFYDIASALPYPDFYEPKIKLAMKLGGYYRLSAIGRSAWERLARDLRLDASMVVDRVRELAERVPDAFGEVCSDDSVAELASSLPAQLLDAVAGRARRCVRDMS